MRKRAILLSDYENQKMWKRLRRIGGGRPPVFPLSEKNVAKLVKARREVCKLTSKSWVLDNVEKEAKEEDPVAFRNFNFSTAFFANFLRRQGNRKRTRLYSS